VTQRKWTAEDEQFILDNYKRLTNKDLATALGRTVTQVKGKKSRMGLKAGKLTKAEYAIYKGDEFICWGTARHCAEQLKVNIDVIRKYASIPHRKKFDESGGTIAIRIDD
jgi:hypothetical protein